MEPEEISVVLSRASELHLKLADAIALVSRSSLPSHSPSSISSPSSFTFHSSSSSSSIPSSESRIQNGFCTGVSELQSLVSVRDALHVLEQQLESLQVLQQQQRAERDTSLAEIEESRRKFLKQLKDYRGREIEIIHEAFAFAGGNVTESEELIVPSSYQIINDVDEVSGSQHISRPIQEQINQDNIDDMDNSNEQGNIDEQHLHSNQEAFGLYIEEGQEEDGSEIMSFLNRNNDKDSNSGLGQATLATSNASKRSLKHLRALEFAVKSVKNTVTFFGQVIGRITGHITWPSSKVVLILLSTIVLLSLMDPDEKKKKSTGFRVPRMTSYGSHHHAHILEQSAYKVDEEDDEYFPKCIVRERIELPFYKDLQAPDILYGRG